MSSVKLKSEKQCVCCDKILSKNNTSGVCADCKSDETKVITTTNIKKIFGMTNKEIEDSDLYYFNVSGHGNVGRKFIVKDVEEYVDNLIKKGNIKLQKKKEKYNNTIKSDQRKVIHLIQSLNEVLLILQFPYFLVNKRKIKI